VPAGFNVVTEGKASVLFPAGEAAVFYNKVQCFNRDLSIVMIKTFIAKRKKELGAPRRQPSCTRRRLPSTGRQKRLPPRPPPSPRAPSPRCRALNGFMAETARRLRFQRSPSKAFASWRP
jgi:tRNA G26 N,N-dimethylase Trm1